MCGQRRTREVIAAQEKLPLMYKRHSIGQRWDGVFLHRVSFSPEKDVLLRSCSKALRWLRVSRPLEAIRP